MGTYIFILAAIGIAYFVISQQIRFKRSTKILPNIVFRLVAIQYPVESREELIHKLLNAEKRKENQLIIQKNIKLKEQKKPLLPNIKPTKSGKYIVLEAQKRAEKMDHDNIITHKKVGESFIKLKERGSDKNAELISYAHRTAKDTVTALMKSPEHRKIILNRRYDYDGIGCRRDEHNYWIDDIIYVDEKTVN